MSSPTLVVIPSLSFHPHELQSVKGISHFEERLLYVILGLHTLHPMGIDYSRIVYITSTPLDPWIVTYYKSLVPGVQPEEFLALSVEDDAFLPLAQKVRNRPGFMDRVRSWVKEGCLMCIRGTHWEWDVAHTLSFPLMSCHPDELYWGTKSGSRLLFQTCQIPHPDGTYQPIFDAKELAQEILSVCLRNPGCKRGVVKLLDGYAGKGNAILDVRFLWNAESERHVDMVYLHLKTRLQFVCPTLLFEDFEVEMQEMGAIFELFVESIGTVTSPSVQAVVYETGYSILSTHEQTLEGQSYTGCTFPAQASYSPEIIEYTTRIAKTFHEKGVYDHFSVDFLCTDQTIQAIEINLRLTGTTHPFMACHYLCQGTFTPEGLYVLEQGEQRCYVSSDHLEHDAWKKWTPKDLYRITQTVPECTWNAHEKIGVVFHLLGCLPLGSMGMTAIGRSREHAQRVWETAVNRLIQLAA
jgi:hypothetical protein